MNGVIQEARYYFRAPNVQRAAALRLMLRNLQMPRVRIEGRGRQVEMRANDPAARRLAVTALDALYADEETG